MCFVKYYLPRQANAYPTAFKKFVIRLNQPTALDSKIRTLKPKILHQLKELGQVTQSPIWYPQGRVLIQLCELINRMNLNNEMTVDLLEKNQNVKNNLSGLQNTLMIIKTKELQISLGTIKNDRYKLSDMFIEKLFGFKQYQYELVLEQPLNQRLYKQRNFDIKVKLVDGQKKPCVQQQCYSFGIFGLYQKTNQTSLIKGSCEGQIYHGHSQFRKLHLREVTSYYKNGWVYFIVYPKAPSFKYNYKESSLEQVIDYSMIKPLVISQIAVRSKKQ